MKIIEHNFFVIVLGYSYKSGTEPNKTEHYNTSVLGPHFYPGSEHNRPTTSSLRTYHSSLSCLYRISARDFWRGP